MVPLYDMSNKIYRPKKEKNYPRPYLSTLFFLRDAISTRMTLCRPPLGPLLLILLRTSKRLCDPRSHPLKIDNSINLIILKLRWIEPSRFFRSFPLQKECMCLLAARKGSNHPTRTTRRQIYNVTAHTGRSLVGRPCMSAGQHGITLLVS